jgi:biotin carboxylase
MPRVLLLATSRTYRNEAFFHAAERLGIDVVVGEDVPLPFLSRSAAEMPLDYRDLPRSVDVIARHAAERPFDAILGVDDSGTLLAARAAERLGLPHNDPEAAAAARNKHVMRGRFAAHGVPSPAYRLFHAADDPADIAREVSYPCVVKPTMLSASKGVMRADDPAQLVDRVHRLRRILAADRCDEILVEDYIPGVEVALEGMLDGGHLEVLALFDKPDPLEGPFFEETLYVTPSRLPAGTQQSIARAAAAAAAALGLRSGPLHAELRVNDRGPWLLEVAGRSIGGLCSRTLRFGAGASLEELILRQACGLGLGDVARERGARGVLMIPIPRAGLLRSVSGVEEARRMRGIDGVEITAPLNAALVPLPEGDSYLGFVFARGDTPDDVEAALRLAQGQLRFEIAPDLPRADPR